MEAAERASLRPINAAGAEAVKKGRANWAAAPNMTKARLAQEWMSWALPARCVSTATTLEQRAKLQGPAFRVNAPVEAAPAEPTTSIDSLLKDNAAHDAAPIVGTPLEERSVEDVPPEMAPDASEPKPDETAAAPATGLVQP